MSFLLEDGVKVTEQPFNRLFPELGRLADEKDIDSLMAVRRKIHEEFLADVGDDEAKRRRLEGIEWQIGQQHAILRRRYIPNSPIELDERISYIQAHMWDGAEVVKDPQGPGLGSF